MNCEGFLIKLDAYLDGELAPQEREAFLRHAQSCSACREELRRAEAIGDALAHINDGLCVPLAAQAAWRDALRREHRRRKGRVLSRALSAAAAVFVLLAGTTVLFRSTGVLDFDGGSEPVSGVHIAATAPRKQYYDAPPQTDAAVEPFSHAQVEADGSLPDATAVSVLSDGEDAAVGEAAPAREEASQPAGAREAELFFRSAVREMYTETFDATRRTIDDLIEEYNGRLVTDALSGQTGARTATLAVDVPAEELDAFLEALDFAVEPTYKSVNSEDISANYYDAQGRLETLRLEKERLNALISEAGDAGEIAELDAQLEDVYAQIDTLESKLRAFDGQLAYARVDIVLKEGAQLAATAITGGGSGATPKQGLARSLAALGTFFSDMGVSMAVIAPYAGIAVLLIAAVWVVVALVSRRRRHD